MVTVARGRRDLDAKLEEYATEALRAADDAADGEMPEYARVNLQRARERLRAEIERPSTSASAVVRAAMRRAAWRRRARATLVGARRAPGRAPRRQARVVRRVVRVDVDDGPPPPPPRRERAAEVRS